MSKVELEEPFAGSFDWNHVAADHAQEWLVGTSKDAGCIVGVTNKPSTLQRWALSFHWRTEIATKAFDMYGLTQKINKHIEENPGRRKRDMDDENTILKYLHHLKVLSLDISPDQLQNAATKDVATKEIEVSFLTAYDEGRKTAIEQSATMKKFRKLTLLQWLIYLSLHLL